MTATKVALFRPAATATLGARYNAMVAQIMPHMAGDLTVDAALTNACHIDEVVFHRSEYLGGMAAVILALIA